MPNAICPRLARRAVRYLPLVLTLAACDSEPTGVDPIEPEPCVLASFGSALAVPAPSTAALRPVLEDAATRLAPSLAELGVDVDLGPALEGLSADLAGADADARCRAFNAAATAFADLSEGAPAAARPDLGALRLALGFTHAWLTAQP